MAIIQLGMIGCGQISERFFKQAEALTDVKFIATCAKHLESAERKGREHGIEHWFDDYERMMDEVALDGVVVTTPHSLHAAPCMAAFRRGIHVLNEKPMATSLEDCKEMVRLAEKHDCVFMQLPFDHTPAFLSAVTLLNEETLGKFTGAESVLMIPGPPRDNWYYDKSIAQGGAMLDCLVYPMSRLISLLGPARRVTAMVNNLIPRRIVAGGKRVNSDVDDNCTLIVEWASGQQAVVRSLWGTSFSQSNTAIYGRKATLFLDGANVVLHSREGIHLDMEGWKDGRPEEVEWRGFKNCFRVPTDASISAESMIKHFAACIREKREPKCSGRLQLHAHEILFKAYESAETGKTQELDTTFDLWHEVEASFFDTRSEFI